MRYRQGNNPKRRVAPADEVDRAYLEQLLGRISYTGSPHHKRIPADYGFHPPASPRPDKSLCDANGSVRIGEATALFREAIDRGMISSYRIGDYPKYVWAVDENERVFEAKLEKGRDTYHGYELGDDEKAMRQVVIEEWDRRCPET